MKDKNEPLLSNKVAACHPEPVTAPNSRRRWRPTQHDSGLWWIKLRIQPLPGKRRRCQQLLRERKTQRAFGFSLLSRKLTFSPIRGRAHGQTFTSVKYLAFWTLEALLPNRASLRVRLHTKSEQKSILLPWRLSPKWSFLASLCFSWDWRRPDALRQGCLLNQLLIRGYVYVTRRGCKFEVWIHELFCLTNKPDDAVYNYLLSSSH